MSLWESGDLVPFVVVVKHTAVDATDCCQALPVIQDMLMLGHCGMKVTYMSVTQVNALRGQ